MPTPSEEYLYGMSQLEKIVLDVADTYEHKLDESIVHRASLSPEMRELLADFDKMYDASASVAFVGSDVGLTPVGPAAGGGMNVSFDNPLDLSHFKPDILAIQDAQKQLKKLGEVTNKVVMGLDDNIDLLADLKWATAAPEEIKKDISESLAKIGPTKSHGTLFGMELVVSDHLESGQVLILNSMSGDSRLIASPDVDMDKLAVALDDASEEGLKEAGVETLTGEWPDSYKKHLTEMPLEPIKKPKTDFKFDFPPGYSWVTVAAFNSGSEYTVLKAKTAEGTVFSIAIGPQAYGQTNMGFDGKDAVLSADPSEGLLDVQLTAIAKNGEIKQWVTKL